MTDLKESGALQATKVSGTRYRARLIEGDRWGSSGYYPREVLERDGPNVWPESTQIYLDHPTEREDWERPERSVRDLAGKITSTPVYESDGLYADVEFYPHTAPVLEALWADVGMSIRAAGTTESGKRDGRTGPIITSLSEGLSVDVVTRAGAGGKLVSLLESARGTSRPSQTIPAPAGTGTQETDTKEAATMADTTDTSRVDEADPKNPFSPKGGDNSGGNSNETEVEKLRRENGELKAEIKRLKAQGAKESRRHEVAGIVEEAFENIDAPATKDALIESFTASDKDTEQIVKEAKTFADELTFAPNASGSVRGLGESRPVVTESDDTPITFADLEALKGA